MSRLSPVIVLDRDIPGAEDIFSGLGEVVAVPGDEIGPETVRKADIVVVRSITRIDESLLSGSSVGFVGSATAGIDHLDTAFLSGSGISWANAPGANAESVVEYVLAAIAVIASRLGVRWRSRTLGVVGCGQVGERLSRRGEALGMHVLRNDPPRAADEGQEGFVSLSQVLTGSDIVSVHTPLVNDGPDNTVRLLNAENIGLMKPGSWLIQSSRGGVVDERAAVKARRSGRLAALVLDVFENEPDPDPEIVAAADLATGHIAGYSRDAKRSGVLMIRDAVLRHLGIDPSTESRNDCFRGDIHLPRDAGGDWLPPQSPEWLDGIISQLMDIRSDDSRFRKALLSQNATAAFHRYRASYPPRYAWSGYGLASPDRKAESDQLALLAALGLNIQPANRGDI